MKTRMWSFLFFLSMQVNAQSLCDDLFASLQVARLVTTNIEAVSVERVPMSVVEKETGAKRTLRITSLKTKGGAKFSELEIFNDQSDLIIGIDITGNTQGHTYLIVNGTRVDGRMFFAAHTEMEEGWDLSNGLIVRYKNLPPENKAALLEWLNGDETLHVPTCVAAACKILFKEADFENKPSRNYWFPSKLLAHLAKTGLVGSDGKKIPAEIYTINTDVQKMWNNLPSWKSVPFFIFKVLFDPYTWQGGKAAAKKTTN